MSNEIIKQFLETMNSDPKAGELLKGYEAPADQAGEYRIYAEIASKLGYDITEEDLKTYLAKTAELMAGRTEESAAGIKELPDEVLDQVAGGKKDHDSCKDTYQDRENCWINDGCDSINNMYSDYICHIYYWNKACHEPSEPCDKDAYCHRSMFFA